MWRVRDLSRRPTATNISILSAIFFSCENPCLSTSANGNTWIEAFPDRLGCPRIEPGFQRRRYTYIKVQFYGSNEEWKKTNKIVKAAVVGGKSINCAFVSWIFCFVLFLFFTALPSVDSLSREH